MNLFVVALFVPTVQQSAKEGGGGGGGRWRREVEEGEGERGKGKGHEEGVWVSVAKFIFVSCT